MFADVVDQVRQGARVGCTDSQFLARARVAGGIHARATFRSEAGQIPVKLFDIQQVRTTMFRFSND